MISLGLVIGYHDCERQVAEKVVFLSRLAPWNRRGGDSLSPGSGDEPSPLRGSWLAFTTLEPRTATINGAALFGVHALACSSAPTP